jgi:heavy metal translocating P-type ATPase
MPTSPAAEDRRLPTVVHTIPGRTRLRLPPRLTGRERLLAILAALEEEPKVTGQRFNAGARCIVVEHHPALTPGRLRRLIAGAQPGKEPTPVRRPARSRSRSVLALAAGGALALVGQPVAAPLIALGAAPIFERAVRRLRDNRSVGVDALDAAAFTLTVAGGQLLTAALMAGLVETGEWMRDLTAARTRRALGELMVHADATTWKLAGSRRVRVPVGRIGPGDVVLLGAGDRVPVDGRVVAGTATLDERLLSGESIPVLRTVGDQAFAMTTVAEGELRLRASGAATDSRAGRIMTFLEQAPIGETRMADHARRLADRFVLPVMGLSAGTYLLSGSVSRAASILIFDLATGIRVAAPTTMLAALIGAAREGILIKGAASIERLAQVDTVVLDKTGTLTYGRPRLVDIQSLNGVTPEELLGIAAAVDQGVNHPLAHAIVAETARAALPIPECSERTYEVGFGASATADGGRRFHVGNRAYMEAKRIAIPEPVGSLGGSSEVFVADPSQCLGAIYFVDEPRETARQVVARLGELGVDRLVLLTGDTQATAEDIALRLGIREWRARVAPEEKAEIVRRLKEEGRTVAVVGDGINDSLAFALADVPIAMGEGAEVARATANVVLLEDRLELLPMAIERSKKALKILNQNLAVIGVPNALGLGGALLAPMNPAVAALLSNGSTVAAAGNGLRPLLSRRPRGSD